MDPILVFIIISIFIGGILIFFLFTKLAASSRKRAKKLEMKKYYSLSEANEFFELGKYPQSVIQGFKVLEFVLKDLLEDSKMEQPTIFDLLVFAQKNNRLSKSALNHAHTARKVRNDAVHGKREVTRDDAITVLGGIREIMRELGL